MNILCTLFGHKNQWVYVDGTLRADGKIVSYPWYVACARCDAQIKYPPDGKQIMLPGEEGYLEKKEKVRYE
jgi:hypothetical protein